MRGVAASRWRSNFRPKVNEWRCLPYCRVEFPVELRSLNGIPQKLSNVVELMQAMLPVLRTGLAVCGTYMSSTEPPSNSPSSFLGGLQVRPVSRGGLEAWRIQPSVPFSSRIFRGDRCFLQTAQPFLLQVLSQYLRGGE